MKSYILEELCKGRCNTLDRERLRYAQINCDLRRGALSDLPTNMKPWKCGMRECILLSRADHLKGHHNNPYKPSIPTCLIVLPKITMLFVTTFENHLLDRRVVGHADPVNPGKNSEFICHICYEVESLSQESS